MKKRIDTVILALTLFFISGAILAYNIHTVKSGELAVSLYDLVSYTNKTERSAISSFSDANLLSGSSIFTGTVPSVPPDDTAASNELLPPIVTPPAE